MSTELVVIEETRVPAVFAPGGLDPILGKIASEVQAIKPDVTTAKGRSEIASLAHKVARSKTYLDGLGKSLVESEKKRLALVDTERKRMRDYLDELKETVRRPLTEWEQAEQARINGIKDRIQQMLETPAQVNTVAEIENALASIKAVQIDDSFAEFANEAAKVKDTTVTALEQKLTAEKQRIAQQEELERLRREAEENARRRREEEIARQAADAERQRVEREKADELAKVQQAAEAERQRVERENAAALEQARRQAAEAEAKLANERLAAERAAAEQRQLEAERQAREADKQHRLTINRAAHACLMDKAGLDSEQAKAVITAIVKGEIKNVNITY